MGMVGGLDVHRAQITFDWVDHDTGEVGRGRVAPATREQFRCWLEQLPTREGAFAVEATTGWRFVVDELQRAGFEAHLAKPADTAAAQGRKRRAKTDRADASRSASHAAHDGPRPAGRSGRTVSTTAPSSSSVSCSSPPSRTSPASSAAST
jgi:transposase